jgi:penicillin-binding protein 1C
MNIKRIIGWVRTNRIKVTGFMVLAVLILTYALCLPSDLFEYTSYSTVVTSCEGELLGARIADDGQWRFPPADTVSEKFSTCLIEFEDRYFRYHPGVNPISVIRALK